MVIRIKRENAGISQEDLAKKAGVSRISISRYENGDRIPSLDIAARIASALGCKIDDLIGNPLDSVCVPCPPPTAILPHQGGDQHG